MLTDQEIIIEVAKLDGFNAMGFPHYPEPDLYFQKDTFLGHRDSLPPYLTSRDAIIPVIEKCFEMDKVTPFNKQEALACVFWSELNEINDFFEEGGHTQMLLSTPYQLCIALLKATGRWREKATK